VDFTDYYSPHGFYQNRRIPKETRSEEGGANDEHNPQGLTPYLKIKTALTSVGVDAFVRRSFMIFIVRNWICFIGAIICLCGISYYCFRIWSTCSRIGRIYECLIDLDKRKYSHDERQNENPNS
jgi:hypothetical protein